jgi:hypothetical protein
LICNIIKEIRLNQGQPYRITPTEPLYSYLVSMPFLDEKELYTLSLLREPRGYKTLAQQESYEKGEPIDLDKPTQTLKTAKSSPGIRQRKGSL